MTKFNKEGWENIKLGEVITEYSKKNKADDDIPVYSVTNSAGFCREYFSKEVASQDKSTYKIVPYGCFAYNPSRINVGSIGLQEEEERVIVSPLYNVFSTSERIDNHFLLYFMKSKVALQIINAKATGSVRMNLRINMLKDFDFNLPPLPIQQRIVEELDEINSIISAKKQQLSKLDELAQSIFYNMFGDPVSNEKGWEVQALGTLSELKNGLNFDKTTSGIKLRFLGVSEFQDNRVLSSRSMPFICVKEEPREEFFLHDGDIVFVRSNGSKDMIGRSVLVSVDDYEKISFSGFCIRCRITSSNLNLKYTQYVVQHPSIRHLITHAGRGCNISNLNQKILSALLIPLPPLALQEIFATRISAIEEQKAVISASIEKMKTLLNARMQEYFE